MIAWRGGARQASQDRSGEDARVDAAAQGHGRIPAEHAASDEPRRAQTGEEGHGHGHPDGQASEHGHGHGHEHPTGLRGWLTELFRPHSHDAADAVDAALEGSREGIRALKISLVVLAVTAVLQLVVVLLSSSVALLADTIHNLADAMTAVPLWVAFSLARRPPNRRFTYGYGRAEDLAGIAIVTFIAGSAALAAYESLLRLLHPQPVHQAGWVLAAGLIGFAGNELVAVYRIRVGRQIGSAALVADGVHARTDGFTSLGVVVGAIGVLAGFPLADPLVGLLITLAILVVLKGAVRDVGRRLLDAVDPDLVDQVEARLAEVPGVLGVHAVQLRWIGHTLHAEADLAVDDDLTVVQGHDIAHAAHSHLLRTVPRLSDATVHVSPVEAADAP